MNGHRSGASHDDKLIYQHFQLPSHSPSDMKVQILEKVHKKFGSTKLTKPKRERVELKWIKELGAAAPCGINDKINGVGILTSLSTSEVNRIGICNKQVRRRRSRGHRKTTSPSRRQLPTTDDLVKLLVTANGPHQVRTQFYSLPLTSLHKLYKLATDLGFIGDYVSPKARVISIIFYISRFRLFKPVRHDVNCNEIRSFFKLKFVNKGMDDINLSNILHDKRTCEKVPQYFQNRSPPVISHKYSNTVAANILNFNATVRNIDIDDFIKIPPSCDCASSPSNEHVMAMSSQEISVSFQMKT